MHDQGYFSWVWETLQFPEEELLKSPTGKEQLVISSGFDSVMYLRFLKYTIYYFGTLSVYGILVILPVNATGDVKVDF